MDGFEGRRIGLVRWLVLEDDQNALALIKNTAKLFVQNHLRQLLLHGIVRQVDEAGDVFDLS